MSVPFARTCDAPSLGVPCNPITVVAGFGMSGKWTSLPNGAGSIDELGTPSADAIKKRKKKAELLIV